MTCLECGKVLRALNSNHLKKCSTLKSLEEYKLKYPNTQTIDSDILLSISHKGEKNGNYKKDSIHENFCIDCCKPISVVEGVLRCSKCASKIRVNFKGGKHSLKTREQMKTSAALRDKSTYSSVVHTEERKEIIGEQKKLMWSSLSVEEREKRIKSFIKSGHKKKKLTSIELKVLNLLKEHYKDFEVSLQQYINGYFVDLLINQTHIIECFGDYWHCHESLFKDENKVNLSLKLTAKEKRDFDNKRIQILEQTHKVLILWEKEINNNFLEVDRKIKEFLK